jgi:hypothetical protein
MKFIPRVTYAPKVKSLHFESDPAIGRRDASKKLLCTISKVPFFTDRSERNLYLLWRILRKLKVYISKVILRLEGEMLLRNYFLQLVKCPSLPTDRNEMYTSCETNAPKVKSLHFESDPSIRRRDTSKKLLCTISKVPFFTDRSERNLCHLWRMLRNWNVYILKVILRLEGEMLLRYYFVQSVKCPSLPTDRNEVYATCDVFSESEKFTFWKWSFD